MLLGDNTCQGAELHDVLRRLQFDAADSEEEVTFEQLSEGLQRLGETGRLENGGQRKAVKWLSGGSAWGGHSGVVDNSRGMGCQHAADAGRR